MHASLARSSSGMTLLEVLLALFLLMLVSTVVSRSLLMVLRLEQQVQYQREVVPIVATLLFDVYAREVAPDSLRAPQGWTLELEQENEAASLVILSPEGNPLQKTKVTVARLSRR